MIRNSSNCLNDLLAPRDMTPVSVQHAARVLYAPVSGDFEVSGLCTSILSEAELNRSEHFASEYDKAHFRQRRAFRRYCGAAAHGSSKPLSQIDFEETENGRPYLPDLPDVWFSFSSCRLGFLGAWSSTHGIGVDLEDQTRPVDVMELARHYFSEAEAHAVERGVGRVRQEIFFQLWSLKEAALKSIGEGLPYGLDAFQFELSPSLATVHAPSDYGGAELFTPYRIDGTESCAALVIRNPA